MMERVRFCKHCGRLMKESFMFCPFCGNEWKDSNTFSKIVEGGFRKLEEKEATQALGLLRSLEKQLNSIEVELDQFLSHPVS